MTIEDFEDTAKWSQQQWGQAQLGDARRTSRALRLGQALAARPDASLPAQTGSWGEVKAADRLLNEPEVTHAALTRHHVEMARSPARSPDSGVFLFVQDTRELDYTHHPHTQGLGLINRDRGRGFMFPSCLRVPPRAPSPKGLGLAQQRLWTRHKINKGTESRYQRRKRRTEYDLWAEVVEAIGPAPPAASATVWVRVADRASDVFSYWLRARRLRWHCLSRGVQDRVSRTASREEAGLLKGSRQLPRQTRKEMALRGRDGKPKRQALLQVAGSEIGVGAAKMRPERKEKPIRGWAIRGWEESPVGDAIEWVLLSTVEITNAENALEQVEGYASRWIIEEYHKCLKTGCGMEKRQMESAPGLFAWFGFLAIVAVRLLQWRAMSREEPDRPVQEVIPEAMARVVAEGLSVRGELTGEGFWRGVARLGGFIGRQADGDAGWQTLWRGWQRLQDLCWGADFFNARI